MTQNLKESLQVVIRKSQKSKLLTVVGYNDLFKITYLGDIYYLGSEKDVEGRPIYDNKPVKVKSQKSYNH